LYQSELKRFSKKDTALYISSITVGNTVAATVLRWAAHDQYAQTKAKPAYIPYTGLQYWKPTPPEYRDALEPNWGTVSPIAMDSSAQFFMPSTIAFDTARSSTFYKQAKEVYNISKHLSAEQKAIALFWDDNPDLNTFVGHVPTPRRYISPPAHWLNIVAEITLAKHSDIATTAMAFTYTAIVLEDSKIAVWYAKYQTNLIRPVSFIRGYIDADWMPLLVTPPFPEYPSGHSACSMAAATVLSHLFGSDYTFTDSCLNVYHIPARHFKSFAAAADEVSDSRVYGGIHYYSGVNTGKEMGRKIGLNFIKRLK
jgi:membrane-associated phospholipid phosphatase